MINENLGKETANQISQQKISGIRKIDCTYRHGIDDLGVPPAYSVSVWTDNGKFADKDSIREELYIYTAPIAVIVNDMSRYPWLI